RRRQLLPRLTRHWLDGHAPYSEVGGGRKRVALRRGPHGNEKTEPSELNPESTSHGRALPRRLAAANEEISRAAPCRALRHPSDRRPLHREQRRGLGIH